MISLGLVPLDFGDVDFDDEMRFDSVSEENEEVDSLLYWSLFYFTVVALSQVRDRYL